MSEYKYKDRYGDDEILEDYLFKCKIDDKEYSVFACWPFMYQCVTSSFPEEYLFLTFLLQADIVIGDIYALYRQYYEEEFDIIKKTNGKFIYRKFDDMAFAINAVNSIRESFRNIYHFKNLDEIDLNIFNLDGLLYLVATHCESVIEARLYSELSKKLKCTNSIKQVKTQCEILNGKYRVDFLINKKLIVECDGYKYHSEKEKVWKDKERDRDCVLNGYTVMRFTGYEINNNIEQCISQILQYCNNMKKEED